MNNHRQKALGILQQRGFETGTADSLLTALEQAGITLADRTQGEFVCRWVDVLVRAVPPEADTIIRTLTRTAGSHSTSNTHWLEGIEPPPQPANPG